MANCVTCGVELRPERAEKYSYCTNDECRARNARGLRLATVGVNKASDQFVILDERTKDEMASGRYRDAGRTSAGRLGHDRSTRTARPPTQGRASVPREHHSPRSSEDGETWTAAEQNLALAHEVTGRLPLEEIARRLGRNPRTVARMLVAARARMHSRNTA